MLQSLGSQWVRHDWGTEQQQCIFSVEKVTCAQLFMDSLPVIRKPTEILLESYAAFRVQIRHCLPWSVPGPLLPTVAEILCAQRPLTWKPVVSGSVPYSVLWPCTFSLCYLFQWVQLLSHVQLFATPWTEAHQASLSFTVSLSLFKFMSIESVMPANHLILCHPLLLLPSIFPRVGVFSNESVLIIRWQSIKASA